MAASASEYTSELVDLLDLLKRPEGKTLEFRRDLSSPDGVLRSLVAFANTSGGAVLIGVEDRTRHVRGVKEPLDLEERLANLISDHIVPRLVPELEIVPWRRSHVLAIQVYASPVRPHYIRREGLDRGVYVRVGSTNRRADRELIDELRRFLAGIDTSGPTDVVMTLFGPNNPTALIAKTTTAARAPMRGFRPA